ncbi:MAG: CHAT domain-containing protein, partial [Chitinophagales bacterium]
FGLNDMDYLVKDYSIGYAYSANLFLEGLETEASNKEQNYVGFAPVFEKQLALNGLRNIRSCSEAELQPLEGSEREVEQLREMMNGTVFLKEEASKQNFMENGANGRILHLATHACLSEEDPMFNTIHFVNDYLSTYELFNIRLDVDLAILSACNTGSGTLVRGEGIMSLSRGFLYAGCPSIVTSLWNVNDNAAVDIMLNLHANLMEGQSKNDALRSAKLQYLQNKPNRLSAPYFWATFVHIGNPKPIELNSVSTNLYWLLSLLVLGLGSLYLIGRKMRFSESSTKT